MSVNLAEELAILHQLSARELQVRYAQAFGEEAHVSHKAWLVKRIAWRLQALAHGDLSERARQRALELANDADLRLLPPKLPPAAPPSEPAAIPPITASGGTQGMRRLPPPGTVITRVYKGRTLQVQVLAQGFSLEGRFFKSLSAVAKAITGQHCSGYFFFRIGKEQA